MTMTLESKFETARKDFANWYDSKSEETQALIDEIADRTSFIIDEDEYDVFINELESYGITTSDEFEDRFMRELEGQGDEITEDFCMEMIEETGVLEGIPDYILDAIDYSRLWTSTIRFDFTIMEFNENTYMFIG